MHKNLQKLLDALRSDKFNQEPGILCTTELDDYDERVAVGHCCLGVMEVLRTGDNMPQGVYPHRDAAEWLGINLPKKTNTYPEWNPALNITWEQVKNERLQDGIMNLIEGEDVHLSHLNDCGYSFRQIANLIETYGIKEQ